MKLLISTLLVGLLVMMSACVKHEDQLSIQKVIPVKLQDQESRNAEEPSEKIEETEILDLQKSLALTLQGNLSLKAMVWEVKSNEGLILQSKLWKNPELSFSAEHLFGKEGFDAVESQVQVSQVFELGGKIKHRTKVAQMSKRVAIQNAFLLRTDVLARTSELFLDVVELQFKVAQQEKNTETAKTIYNIVQKRVIAGETSPLEEKRALLIYTKNNLQLLQIKSGLSVAKVRLSEMWGNSEPYFKKVSFSLGDTTLQSSLISIDDNFMRSPSIMLAKLQLLLEEEKTSLQKAEATPDLTVNIAYQKYQENLDDALAVGFSFPLPIFNKNQGNVQMGNSLSMRADTELKGIINKTKSKLTESRLELNTIYQNFMVLKNEMHPAVKSLYENAKLGYQKGQFDFLNVLDAQRSLFEINIELIESEIKVLKSIVEINRLLGKVKTDNIFFNFENHD